jgi:hypothetical protein
MVKTIYLEANATIWNNFPGKSYGKDEFLNFSLTDDFMLKFYF